MALAPAIAASKSYSYLTPKRHGAQITPPSRTEAVSVDPSAVPRPRNPRTLRTKFESRIKTRIYE